MNLTGTIFDTKSLIRCKFHDATFQSEGSTGISKWFVKRESLERPPPASLPTHPSRFVTEKKRNELVFELDSGSFDVSILNIQDV